MLSPAKQAAASVVLLAALVALYFGAFLPLQKSQGYISTFRAFQKEPTLMGLEEGFTALFEKKSPVGQEEVLRFLGGALQPLLNKEVPEEGVREIVRFYTDAVAKYERVPNALNYSQLLLTLGGMNQTLWILYGDKAAYQTAERLYQEGLVESLNRPQFLLALRDLYASGGEKDKLNQMVATIRGFWPNQE